MHLRHGFVVASLAAIATSVVGCASSANGSHSGASGNGKGSASGSAGETGSSTGAGASATLLGVGGGLGGYSIRDSGSGAPLGADSACGALVLEPEAVKVDKTVEKKINCTAQTPEPIAIYIMLDNSGSMKEDQKWDNAVAALNTFVQTAPAAGGAWTCVDDAGKTVPPPATLPPPASGEVSVAIQYFHPINVGSNPNECDGSGHSTPAVPMGPLPANGPNITSSLSMTGPTGKTPTVGALLGGTEYCRAYETANSGKKCAVVLVTDGQPNGCGLNTQCPDGGRSECVDPNSAAMLTPIATKAHTDPMHSVVTFTVGMSGVTSAGFNLLDAIAIAGGSDCTPNTPGNEACNVTTSGAAGFLDALNTIRKSVQVTTTSNQSVTTSSTVSTTLACEWSIPKPSNGQTFDKDLVNVTYASASAGKSERLGNVPTQAECAAAAGGWYYDDVNAPTKILACPTTCTTIQNLTDVKVQVLVGCMTVPAIVR